MAPHEDPFVWLYEVLAVDVAFIWTAYQPHELPEALPVAIHQEVLLHGLPLVLAVHVVALLHFVSWCVVVHLSQSS